MTFSRFARLCDSLCAIAGHAAPALAQAPDGAAAFHLRLRGYVATVMHAPALNPGAATLQFEVGARPASLRTDDACMLLKMNLMAFGPCSPMLGMTGDDRLMFMQSWPLETATATAVHEQLVRLAEWSDRWHAGEWTILDEDLSRPDVLV